MLEAILQELSRGFADQAMMAVVSIRLALAALVGGIVGLERSWTGKLAGLRTHMLVCLGSAIFVMSVSLHSVNVDALSRVIQGTATGIGFVGAGAILKLSDRGRVKGLTTAANIWMTAALGSAVGTGHYYLPTAGVFAALITLAFVERLEERIEERVEARRKKPAKLLPSAESTDEND